MLSIGAFARLVGVSVRMLRHYDRLGLLVPARVDEFSGYRYYSPDQLDRANQLVALKDLGFSLDDVGRLLAEPQSSDLVAQMLRERRTALLEQIRTDEQRVRQVEARLRLIEKEVPMSEHTYVETDLPELRLVQLSARVTEMSQIESEIGPMFQRVNEAVERAGATRVGPGVAHYTGDGDELVAAAAEQVGDAPTPDGLEPARLAAAPRALTVRYTGPDLVGLPQAWQGLVREVERRDLTPAGTAREIYLATPYDGAGSGWDVDLQQPVE